MRDEETTRKKNLADFTRDISEREKARQWKKSEKVRRAKEAERLKKQKKTIEERQAQKERFAREKEQEGAEEHARSTGEEAELIQEKVKKWLSEASDPKRFSAALTNDPLAQFFIRKIPELRTRVMEMRGNVSPENEEVNLRHIRMFEKSIALFETHLQRIVQRSIQTAEYTGLYKTIFNTDPPKKLIERIMKYRKLAKTKKKTPSKKNPLLAVSSETVDEHITKLLEKRKTIYSTPQNVAVSLRALFPGTTTTQLDGIVRASLKRLHEMGILEYRGAFGSSRRYLRIRGPSQ